MLLRHLLNGRCGRALAWGLSLTMVYITLPRTPAWAAPLPQEVAKIERYASEYKQAMGLLQRVGSMNLSQKTELKRAIDLLKQADPGLRRWRYWAIDQAAKNETLRETGRKELTEYLSKHPQVTTKIKQAKVGADGRMTVDTTAEVKAWVQQMMANPQTVGQAAGDAPNRKRETVGHATWLDRVPVS